MEQLTIALGRFPFTNQIDYKIRPAVIISNEKFNQAHNFVWACPITTKQTKKEFELEIPEKEFSGKLEEKSFIRTDTIASIEKELFIKQMGKISKNLFEKLKNEITKNL